MALLKTASHGPIQKSHRQSVEVDLPPDIKDGELFIGTQGFETNRVPYTIDICKKDRKFSTASNIQEFVKCLY